MLKFSFTNANQARITEKIMELGNIAAGALIFGQATSRESYKVELAIIGSIILLITYSWSMILLKKKPAI